MADAILKIDKKRCVKCDDAKNRGGLFTCDGCQQMFCLRQVNEHRQELNIQLENAMQEHDLMQQEASRLTLDQSILEKIDAWEKRSIIKIQMAAETTRADFRQWFQSANDRIRNECGELAKNLRSARESEDFSEQDLSKWNEMLQKLRTYQESMTKVDITEGRQSCVSYIKVQHETVWSADAPFVKDRDRPIRQSISQATNRTDANRSENTDLQTSCDYRRIQRREPNNNNKRVREYKQQECKQQ
jgi:hypothetical protein